MQREPAGDPAPNEAGATRDETGEKPATARSENPAEDDPKRDDEPKPEDDGSVPRKQISRWKGEGGSWLPTD
jgi:hypothetical protein